jgi:hypothetical protein
MQTHTNQKQWSTSFFSAFDDMPYQGTSQYLIHGCWPNNINVICVVIWQTTWVVGDLG